MTAKGTDGGMTVAALLIVVVTVAFTVVAVFGVFAWAAKKDGEEDRAIQRRLGIRRRTRLGR
jgi:NADH:ubiquinone oxidoreductase subunit 2 (subunit N)